VPDAGPLAPPGTPAAPGGIDLGAPTPGRRARERSVTSTVLQLVALAVAGAGLAWIVPRLLAGATGPLQVTVVVLLALVPFVGLVLAVKWIDAWEPEPRGLVLVAVTWGAGVGPALAAGTNGAFQYATSGVVGSEAAATLTALVSAPITEETLKGLGIVVVLLVGRGQLRGPVDGVVYAFAVGAGFAAVENLQYFLTYWDNVTAVFIQRGLMTPMVHPMFTLCTGLAIGIATNRRGPGRWWIVLPGWLAAIVLHALWNLTAVSGSFSVLYLSFQVPLFGAVVLLVLWLRGREKQAIRLGLRDYHRAGWISAEEVTMIMSTRSRRDAVAWAGRRGGGRRESMLDFQRTAVQLALARRRLLASGGSVTDDERALELARLHRLTADREEIARA
jgi:RsiW-degrading membrane proteinase PrsW (M82 family)